MVKKVKADTNDSMFKFTSKSFDEHREESIRLGINMDGIDGVKVDYSSKKLPSWIRRKHILNAGGAYAVKFIPMQSWGDFRLAQGLKNRFVNLKYTGEHWESYLIMSSHFKVYIVYFGDKGLMSKLEDRYGEFYNVPPRIYNKFQDLILKPDFRNSIIKSL
jgi:hypothetical protein